MNPLAAIRPWTPPELRADAMPNGLLSGGLANIPAQELAGLKLPDLNPIAGAGSMNGSSGNVFGQLFNEVVAKQNEAGQAVAGVLSSQGVPLHQAMIAMQEANLSFQLMLEVRNKLLESYQELMRMQI